MNRTSTIIGCCMFVVPLHAAQFLVNGGAESGNLSGWTAVLSGASRPSNGIIASVTSQAQSGGEVVGPIEPNWFFSFAARQASTTDDSGDHVYMYQTGTTGLLSQKLVFSGQFQTANEDAGQARIYILDGESNVLATASTALLAEPDYPQKDWHPFQVSTVVPQGAASWRVELHGTVRTGYYINTFYDALVLDGTPLLPAPILQGRLYFGVSVEGNLGRTYRIDYTESLPTNVWTTMTNIVLRASPTVVLDPDPLSGPRRFYRAVELP